MRRETLRRQACMTGKQPLGRGSPRLWCSSYCNNHVWNIRNTYTSVDLHADVRMHPRLHDANMDAAAGQGQKRDLLTQVPRCPPESLTHITLLSLLQVLFCDHLIKTRPEAALVQPFWFACMRELRALLAKRIKESTFLHNLPKARE